MTRNVLSLSLFLCITVGGVFSEDIVCAAGTKSTNVILNKGDSFTFRTGGKKYKKNMECSGTYQLGDCPSAVLTCTKFITKANKKCTKGDVMTVTDDSGSMKFCRKKKPVEKILSGDFSITFKTDAKKQSKGLMCTVTCSDDGSGSGTGSSPAPSSPGPSSTSSPGTTPASTTSPSSTGSVDCPNGCEYQIKINQVWAQEPAGYDRTAEVKVPATPAGVRRPVVIDLHGSGGNANVNRMGSFLRNSIIVAAQGYQNQWNIVKERTKAPDVAFIGDLITKIGEIQQADMDDVTIIGTSNGAGLICRLLIETPNPRPFSRVIPMVSHMVENQYRDETFWQPSNQDNLDENVFDEAVVPASPGPEYIYFHGTADRTVPYEGGQSLGVTFIGAQPTTYAFAKAFGFSGPQLADSEGVAVQSGVTKYEYNGASRVVHYKMEDMGHNAFDQLYRTFVQDLIKTTIEG